MLYEGQKIICIKNYGPALEPHIKIDELCLITEIEGSFVRVVSNTCKIWFVTNEIYGEFLYEYFSTVNEQRKLKLEKLNGCNLHRLQPPKF